MSVNITVNGKYIKHCQRHDLLIDAERAKKEIENERRKMRIQQVRDMSKNIAKKVRSNVELEKENQLKKIEEIKAQEMEMWRQNVLSQKENDFRSSIFHVGMAHRAARSENSKQAAKKEPCSKGKKPFKSHEKIAPRTKSADKENFLKNVNVQTHITGKCYPKPNGAYKSKNRNSFGNKLVSNSIEINSEFEENSPDSSSYSSQNSSLSVSDSEDTSKNEDLNQIKSKTTGQVNRLDPALLQVEPKESGTSLIDTSKTQIHSNVPNIHFSRALSKNTQKPLKSNAINTKTDLKSSTEEVITGPSTSTAAKQRFTQISDIIRQQTLSDETDKSSVPIWEPEATLKPQKCSSKSKFSSSRHLQTSIKEPIIKSPSNSRPVSTQTASKTCSSRSSNTRVQFYDYNNKFHKQYNQPTSAVEAHEPNSRLDTEINAMELAALENKSRESREVEMNKLRQKSAERCKKATEREQVRRACEELTAKLDALTKRRQVLPSDNHQFASHRLQQVTKEKETILNNALEDILKRPAIITCPVIERPKSETINASDRQPKHQINGLNVESAFKQSQNNSLNSSDSCCSILLGYVDDQSKQIAHDIQKFKKENGETNNAKAVKLQSLLNRINKVRENLIKELEQCSVAEASDKDRVQIMMDSITDLRKEHANILIDDGAKDSIEMRENKLKKKEAVLEKKLREFYEIHKAAKKMKHLEKTGELPNKSQKSNEQNESEKTIKSNKSSKKAVEHNKQNDQPSKQDTPPEETQSKEIIELQQSDKIVVNKQEEYSSSEEESEDEFVDRRKLIVGQKPVKIVIKVKSDTKAKKNNKIPSKSPRKLSTLIQSPGPKKHRRKFTTVRSVDSNSTSYRSLPSKIQNNVDKIFKSVPNTSKAQVSLQTQSETPSDEEIEQFKKKSSNLNPLMAHYIQRLLGMSRTSINALGVTSSDIETPSNSIINTTANLSAAETERLASSRLENVQKFIEDNYSFIGELEESLRQSNSTDSSLKTAEVAWKKTLKVDKLKNKHNEMKTVLKPTLKKPSKTQKTQSREHKQPISLVDKATQMTDNCTQRIAELTEMINKVRKEKQKILETTLSSASENGRNSTEYLDLPERRNNSDESTTKMLDSQLVKSLDNLPTKSPEMAPRLEKDKLTGMSRDSGISLSRPITVQESRESPIDDMRQVQSSSDSLSGQFKKPKPPISITRYSPQLPEDIPHELSTIFEVDTPATSRLNTSIHAPNVQDCAIQVNGHQTDEITYRKFPSFEKYARINNLDMTQFDPEFSVQFEKEFNEFINLAKEGKGPAYEEFTSFSKYLAKSSSSENKEAAEELLASLKLANLSFKKFPTRQEYLDKIGVSNSDLLDSQSLDNTEKSKHLNSNSSSSSSLINIENELKLRDILIKPFQPLPIQNDDRATSSIESSSINLHSKQQADISGIRQFTSGAISTDDQSNNLEEDLKRIGIKWPSTMKKKTMETQALSSSTSSNVEQSMPNRRKHNNAGHVPESSFHKQAQAFHETTTQTEDGGQQLNLREFLKKELLKRTATSSSFSFSDDSVASSILRSILGSITPSGRQQQPNEVGVPTLDRHKTSTPMASQSISSTKGGSKSQGGTSSIQLFSGESRLSSVHFVNSSTDVNNTAVKNG